MKIHAIKVRGCNLYLPTLCNRRKLSNFCLKKLHQFHEKNYKNPSPIYQVCNSQRINTYLLLYIYYTYHIHTILYIQPTLWLWKKVHKQLHFMCYELWCLPREKKNINLFFNSIFNVFVLSLFFKKISQTFKKTFDYEMHPGLEEIFNFRSSFWRQSTLMNIRQKLNFERLKNDAQNVYQIGNIQVHS